MNATPSMMPTSNSVEVQIGDFSIDVIDDAPFDREWFINNYKHDPIFKRFCDQSTLLTYVVIGQPSLLLGGQYVGICEKKDMDISSWDRTFNWEIIKPGSDVYRWRDSLVFYLHEEADEERMYRGARYQNLLDLNKIADSEAPYPIKFKNIKSFFVADLGKWVLMMGAIESMHIEDNDLYLEEAKDIDDIWN